MLYLENEEKSSKEKERMLFNTPKKINLQNFELC